MRHADSHTSRIEALAAFSRSTVQVNVTSACFRDRAIFVVQRDQ
jgi:hypothetical protein